jgi:hypothetical protein
VLQRAQRLLHRRQRVEGMDLVEAEDREMKQGEAEEQRQKSMRPDWLVKPFIPLFLRFSLFIGETASPRGLQQLSKQYDWAMPMAWMRVSTKENTTSPLGQEAAQVVHQAALQLAFGVRLVQVEEVEGVVVLHGQDGLSPQRRR